MDRNIPAAGAFYREYTGIIYQVKELALQSETKEQMVVYQSMVPPYSTWVRSLAQFMEKLNRPDQGILVQEYRFEPVDPFGRPIEGKKGSEQIPVRNMGQMPHETVSDAGQTSTHASMKPENINTASLEDEAFSKTVDASAEDDTSAQVAQKIAEDGFMQLLDAQTFHEKRQIFISLKQYLDKRLLGNIAVALDIVLEEGNEEEQYEAILHCLDTFEKYETGGRLRG